MVPAMATTVMRNGANEMMSAILRFTINGTATVSTATQITVMAKFAVRIRNRVWFASADTEMAGNSLPEAVDMVSPGVSRVTL